MSLIVETGAIVPGAESYISVADATTYHAARGNSVWAGLASDAVREQKLRQGTDFMLQSYRTRWRGSRVSLTQALDWPRWGVTVDDSLVTRVIAPTIVPDEVKNACAELALRAASVELSPDLERGVIREKVGPIEQEFDRYSPQQKRFTAVHAMISIYLLPGGGASVGLVRA